MATNNVGIELREAIQTGDFGRVSVLVPEFRRCLSCDMQSASSDEARLQKLQAALDFLEESLHLARVMRAHVAAKLRTSVSTSRYQTQAGQESRWSVNA